MNYKAAVKSWNQTKKQLHGSTVMERDEEYRGKLELNELMDRGLSLKEKYGGDKGWML